LLFKKCRPHIIIIFWPELKHGSSSKIFVSKQGVRHFATALFKAYIEGPLFFFSYIAGNNN